MVFNRCVVRFCIASTQSLEHTELVGTNEFRDQETDGDTQVGREIA